MFHFCSPGASTSPSNSSLNLIFILTVALSCFEFISLSFILPFIPPPGLFLHLSYRKIPGNQCEGGFQPDRKETDLGRICTSNAIYSNSLVSFFFFWYLLCWLYCGTSLMLSTSSYGPSSQSFIYANQMQCLNLPSCFMISKIYMINNSF